MARTLVINNANFATNKLATVTFADIACTGITLDKSTDSITSLGGTSTLTATVTPEDTSDAIIWSSSNTDVATVENGVVTAVGCGTVTITATCGNYSATCAVTVTHIAELSYGLDKFITVPASGQQDYFQIGSLSNTAYGYSTTGTKKLAYGNSYNGQYPLVIPNGATKISITCEGCKVKGFWASSTESPENIPAQCLAYPTDSFATYGEKGSREVTIPDRTAGTYEDMDAVVFDFEYQDGTISQEVVDAIVVIFTT